MNVFQKTYFIQSSLILLLCAHHAIATPKTTDNPNVKRNKDGGIVSLLTDKKTHQDSFALEVRSKDSLIKSSAFTFVQNEDETARLRDIDQDGYIDLEVSGACPSSPNCDRLIYRYDPTSKDFYLFYSGAYASLENFDGYLIENNRGGCCSWGHDIYKIPQDRRVLGGRDTVDFEIIVESGDPPICRFVQFTGNEKLTEVTIDPPSPRWLRYCNAYGDKFLVKRPSATIRNMAR